MPQLPVALSLCLPELTPSGFKHILTLLTHSLNSVYQPPISCILSACSQFPACFIHSFIYFSLDFLGKQRETTRSCIHWFTPPDAYNSWAWLGRSRQPKPNPGLPRVWQGHKYFSHHLPPPRVLMGRKLEWAAEPGLRPSQALPYGGRCRCLKPTHSFCARPPASCPLWRG